MAVETKSAWVCEYPNCRHSWLARTDVPPRLCAKCRKANWHKTVSVKEAIRSSNWQEQLMEAVKPFLKATAKAEVQQAIADAKARKSAPEVTPMVHPTPAPMNMNAGKCGYRREDYETGYAGYCGKMSGHKLEHGQWTRGEALDS